MVDDGKGDDVSVLRCEQAGTNEQTQQTVRKTNARGSSTRLTGVPSTFGSPFRTCSFVFPSDMRYVATTGVTGDDVR